MQFSVFYISINIYIPTKEGLLPFIDSKVKKTKVLKDLGHKKNCGCVPSKDIGLYDNFTNGCPYSYANTSPRIAQMNYQKHRSKGGYCETVCE